MRTMLIAVGGNSLIRAGETGTIAEQRVNARRTAAAIVQLIRAGYRLVVTHGNGPQVGAQLLRSERASDQVPGQTLDVCGAATQGEIGYLLSQSLCDELAAAHLAPLSIRSCSPARPVRQTPPLSADIRRPWQSGESGARR